jgi:hypothetical protein
MIIVTYKEKKAIEREDVESAEKLIEDIFYFCKDLPISIKDEETGKELSLSMKASLS